MKYEWRLEGMFSHNGKISYKQLMILLIIQMINVGLLILPNICVKIAGRDGYLLPLTAIPIGIVYLLCITGTVKELSKVVKEQGEQRTFLVTVIKTAILILIIKFIVDMALELRMMGSVIQKIMLIRTPLPLIMLVLLLTATYLAKSGIEAVARMGEILVYFIFIPILVVMIIISFKCDYREVLPFVQSSPNQIGYGSIIIGFGFAPIETLWLLYGMAKGKEKVFKAGSIAIIGVAIFQSWLVLLTICRLGVIETGLQIWPILALMRSTTLKNIAIQSQEVLMITTWIFTTFIFISIKLCISSITLSKCFLYKRENIFILPILAIIYLLSMWPLQAGEVYNIYIRYRYFISIWFLLPVPIIIFIICKLRRNKNEG